MGLRRLFGRQPDAPTTPRKALIVQPCCLGQVMLTTPLLAALGRAFPEARFDWLVGDWARPAIGTNPRLTRLLRAGAGAFDAGREAQTTLLDTLRTEAYDTCFVPGPADPTLLRLLRQANIPQRVGLRHNGRGDLSHAIDAPPGERNLARCFLALARVVGAPPEVIETAEMEFAPPDRDRTAAARWLVEEFDWLGDRPLVVMHPGGGENPAEQAPDKRWPPERFARLANHLGRAYDARIVIVGLAEERVLGGKVTGMISTGVSRPANRAGDIGLGELGALCELATLYVGNDVGSTYIAAATGCPTLAIHGPTDPAVTSPYMINGRVVPLWRPYDNPFSWANGVTVDEAVAAADGLLGRG